jgi:hypothetical protein
MQRSFVRRECAWQASPITATGGRINTWRKWGSRELAEWYFRHMLPLLCKRKWNAFFSKGSAAG